MLMVITIYNEQPSIADEKSAEKVNSFRKKFTSLARKWSPEHNSQWVFRIYFCTQMILNATVVLKQAELAEENN